MVAVVIVLRITAVVVLVVVVVTAAVAIAVLTAAGNAIAIPAAPMAGLNICAFVEKQYVHGGMQEEHPHNGHKSYSVKRSQS